MTLFVPSEPDVSNHKSAIVLELYLCVGSAWWNSVAVMVLISFFWKSTIQTITALLQGGRLSFYALCWINCFECLLHCWEEPSAPLGVFKSYFIGIWGQGRASLLLEGNRVVIFCIGVCVQSGKKSTNYEGKLQQHFLYITVSCCRVVIITNCNVNVM